MFSRRELIRRMASVPVLGPILGAGATDADVSFGHILCTSSHDAIAVTLSTTAAHTGLDLIVSGIRCAGEQVDSTGYHWRFSLSGLDSDKEYVLIVQSRGVQVGDPWPLRTFPAPDSQPQSFKLLSFTCAGGGDGFGFSGRQFFKPLAFRHALFRDALKQKPDAALAIGDHIYWDLRGQGVPQIGRKKPWLKWLIGHYLKWKFGEFDRDQPVFGNDNEEILKAIGREQIAKLYGTQFRSVPMFFIGDDHDYFENDDAEKDLVTFPPDDFSKSAARAMADLFYPPLIQTPEPQQSRMAGRLRFGRLFDGVLLDCAGGLSLGNEASLVPASIEAWAVDVLKTTDAQYTALVPSHPFGYTAGKWREWYPDVVAEVGQDVAMNEIMGAVTGQLGVSAQKYLWQSGWWDQHQRFIQAMSDLSGYRLVISGDIHALGAVEIMASGDIDLDERPLMSVLSGPVSTSDATWPSAARGVGASAPAWMSVRELAPAREVNGFTIFTFGEDGAQMQLFDCGGFDRTLGEAGGVQSFITIELTS